MSILHLNMNILIKIVIFLIFLYTFNTDLLTLLEDSVETDWLEI